MEGEGIGVVGVLRLALDKPPEVEELIHRARKPEGPCCVESINVLSLLKQPLEEGVVEIPYGDGESPFVVFLAYSHGQTPLLHLHPLLFLHDLLLLLLLVLLQFNSLELELGYCVRQRNGYSSCSFIRLDGQGQFRNFMSPAVRT